MARPERFELPTDRFEADYSIQLSYERIININDRQKKGPTLLQALS